VTSLTTQLEEMNEELRGEVDVLKTQNNDLKMENAQLRAEVQHLKVSREYSYML